MQTNPDGSSKGSGNVVYETPQDAQNAIGPFTSFLARIELMD